MFCPSLFQMYAGALRRFQYRESTILVFNDPVLCDITSTRPEATSRQPYRFSTVPLDSLSLIRPFRCSSLGHLLLDPSHETVGSYRPSIAPFPSTSSCQAPEGPGIPEADAKKTKPRDGMASDTDIGTLTISICRLRTLMYAPDRGFRHRVT